MAVNKAEAEVSYEVFDRFDFNIDAEVGSIRYDVYELKDTRAKGRMMPNRLEASSFSTLIEDSDMSGSGTITNMFDYVFDNGTLGGEIQVKSNRFNLNSFMGEEEAGAATGSGEEEVVYEVIEIPKNINMTILSEVDQVQYTNLTLRNVVGKLYMENGVAVLEDATAKGLGGDIGLSGSYSTEDPEKPYFTLKYNLNRLSFEETFNTFNSYAKLAPIGKYITGNLTSSLIMEGELGQDMMPKLETIDAQGFLETINSFLADFQPFDAIGNALNIEELKNRIQLDDIKTWFTIQDGVIAVKPFDVNIKGIGMTIAGSHGLNQSMDYSIKAKIPRELLEKSGIGQAAGNALDRLTSEANKLGFDLKKSEFVNVGINLGGSLTDPNVKYNLLGSEGSQSLGDAAKATVQQEIDEQKEKLEAEINEQKEAVKAEVESKVDAAVDSARVAAQKELDKAKDKALDAVKDQVGEKADTVAQKLLDNLLKKDTSKTTDQIKDQLEKFNPFKKKKKTDKGGGDK
jgi:F0F1-type ATP synthase membrane subunit b/b'